MKNKRKKANVKSNTESSVAKTLTTSIIVLGILASASGFTPDSLKITTHPQITLLGEYDNNVYLLNKQDDNFKQDFVFHLLPKFGITRNVKKHSYGLALDGDVRKGVLSAPLQSNIQTGGYLNLRYNNGIQLSLKDYYMLADFDLGLTDMPGITQRQMNNFGSKLSYTFVEKLKIYGSYDNRWFTYKDRTGLFDRKSNIYGTGLSYNFSRRFKIAGDYKKIEEGFNEYERISNRTIDEINSKFIFPITASFGSYLSYGHLKQNSKEIPYRNYTGNSYVYGVTWEGRNRLLAWLEVGYEEMDFENSLNPDYKNPIGEIGCKIKFTEFLSAKLSVGSDVYKNLAYDGELKYDNKNNTSLRLAANRKTQTYFLTFTPKNTYVSYRYLIDIKTKLTETIQLKMGSSYQTRDDYSEDFTFPTSGRIYSYSKTYFEMELVPSKKFLLAFKGSYIFQDSDSEQISTYQYNTWVLNIRGEYTINDNMKAGAHYQASTRNGTAVKHDFNNNRTGLFFTYLF